MAVSPFCNCISNLAVNTCLLVGDNFCIQDVLKPVCAHCQNNAVFGQLKSGLVVGKKRIGFLSEFCDLTGSFCTT